MRICLVSTDKRLDRKVREACAGFPELAYHSAGKSAMPVPVADLYLRDLDGSASFAQAGEVPPEAGSVFLVHRDALAAFHERFPGEVASVLLKPVTRAVLERFLGRALERFRNAPGAGVSADPRRSDRDELLECLLLASLRLQHHGIERTNFLARALHDFQAPLTAASGYCGLLIQQQLGPLNREQIEIVERMQRNLRRLAALSRTMFRLSVNGSGEDEPVLEPADIERTIERAVDEITPAAEVRDITIDVRVAPQSPFPFDAAQIEQVLVNLLENACRFAPSHSLIEVRGYLVSPTGAKGSSDGAGAAFGSSYRVDIIDSGPGIPLEHLHRVFEQYVSSCGSQDRSGTGLGLATCKMIITAHHGEIFAESRAAGATFSFFLPLAQHVAEQATEEFEPAAVGVSSEIRSGRE